jgi:hypothetical protein
MSFKKQLVPIIHPYSKILYIFTEMFKTYTISSHMHMKTDGMTLTDTHRSLLAKLLLQQP